MPDVSKIKLPDNSELNIKDARIPGVDSTPTSGSSNLVTSGGVYNSVNEVSLVAAAALNELNDRVTDLESTTSSGVEESDNIFYYTVSNVYSPTANELNGLYDLADAVLTDGNIPSLVLTDGTDTILYLFNFYQPNTEIDFIFDSGIEYTMILLYEDGTLDAETYEVYRKPSTGIPASDLASGVIPTVNDSTITVQVNSSTVDSFTTNAASNKTINLTNIAKIGPYNYLCESAGVKGIMADGGDYYALPGCGNGTTEDAVLATTDDIPDAVTANPTVPSGTTPTALTGLKVGSGYYSISSGGTVGTLVTNNTTAQTASTSESFSGTINLHKVAKTGTYSDLIGTPTISSNVATDKADNTKVAGAKAVYDEVHPAVVSSQPAGGFAPNILYDLGTITGTVTFTMASPSDATIINHYYWTFETSSTAPTITWPAGITSWNGGSAPTIAASKHYEISVLDGVGCYLEV